MCVQRGRSGPVLDGHEVRRSSQRSGIWTGSVMAGTGTQKKKRGSRKRSFVEVRKLKDTHDVPTTTDASSGLLSSRGTQ